jgi:hypothetical protein
MLSQNHILVNLSTKGGSGARNEIFLHTEDIHFKRVRFFGMKSQNVFKWRHYQEEIILQAVRWYLNDSLSLRNVAETMDERGFSMVHTTIMWWVHEYEP